MRCDEKEQVRQQLKRLGVPKEIDEKVVRYYDGRVTEEEREEVERLVRFVVKVLDEDFFSDRLRHGAFWKSSPY